MSGSRRGGTNAIPAYEEEARRAEREGHPRFSVLQGMSVAQLRTLAQEYDVKNYSRKRKDELVEELETILRGR